MFPYKNILVPTDFSDFSLKGLHHALALAQASGATVHLIHVVEEIVYPADWGYAQVGLTDLTRELEKSSLEEMAKLQASLKSAVPVHTAVVVGKAPEAIAEYAKEHSADLVVIATHGRSGIEHFFFGSTTEKVLRMAPCPVLTFRPESEQSPS